MTFSAMLAKLTVIGLAVIGLGYILYHAYILALVALLMFMCATHGGC